MSESPDIEPIPNTSRDDISNASDDERTPLLLNPPSVRGEVIRELSTKREPIPTTSRDNFSNTFEDERPPQFFKPDPPYPARGNVITRSGPLCLIGLLTATVVGLTLAYIFSGKEEARVHEKPWLAPRNEWIYEETPLDLPRRELPAKVVLVLHTNTRRCWSEAECTDLILRIQREHIKYLETADIMYNFMIGNDGRVYEGRGWSYESDYSDLNKDYLAVAFLGCFHHITATPQQVEALDKLLSFGVDKKYLTQCYDVIAPEESPQNIKDLADEMNENVKRCHDCSRYSKL